MSFTTRAGILAGAAALTLTGVGAAGTSTDANHQQTIKELQARVAELEAKQSGGDKWLTEQRAAEIRSIVHDVLADADTRASLLSGMQAGYEDGFQIGDPAGNFLLQVNGQLQARWMYNRQRDAEGQTEDFASGLLTGWTTPVELDDALGIQYDLDHDPDRHRSGFELGRTKLWFSGHVLNPSWRYMIEADFGQRGDFTLLDAWIAHEYGDTGLVITVGQFKLPFLREELVDSRYQQLVERSLVNSYFTTGRSSGLMVSWQGDMIRAFGSWSDGARNLNTASLDYTTEWALTARVEAIPFGGEWGQFNEFRSRPGEEFGMLIGAAMHWEHDEYGVVGVNKTERFRGTVDATAKFDSFNLFGAYIFDHSDIDGGGNFQNHAILVQGGFHLTDDWELFGRYEHVFWDSDLGDAGASDLSMITFGVNHYMFQGGHAAKWTTDFGYALNRVPVGDIRTGWRSDGEDGRSGQFVLRTQIQLAF